MNNPFQRFGQKKKYDAGDYNLDFPNYQQGPKSASGQDKRNYPLDEYEKERQKETYGPQVPAVYKRMMTRENTEAPSRGTVKQGPKMTATMAPETWDSETDPDENLRTKFIDLSVEGTGLYKEYQ